MKVKDRIVELRRVKAKDLLPNPANWRKHPESQRKALRGILEQVGYADALIARETEDGLMLIDGHLRAETAQGDEVPVLVLDVTAEEADLMLATLDPLAMMARPDHDALLPLLESLSVEDPAINRMLEALANDESTPLAPLHEPNLSFLDDALGADEDGKPFPEFDIEGEVEPDEDGLIRFVIPVTADQRTQIMRAVNAVKSSSKDIETTTEALVVICNGYSI